MPVTEKTQQLYVKSFFAASVREAMERARQELGPEALLLNTREAPPEARHMGEYEVVFGSGRGPVAEASPAAPAVAGVDDLRQRMDEIRALLTRMAPASSYFRDCRAPVEQALVEAGVETALAREIAEAVRQRIARSAVREIARPRSAPEWDAETLALETTEEIRGRFEVRPEIGRIAAFVGPPGAGKTTALVKLAVKQGLAAGRAVRILSIDTQRIGAAEQLRTYAAILGVAFQAVESTGALAQAIDSSPSNALVLIDTPGCSAALLRELGSELAGFLASRQDIDTHLVLTASMRAADLQAAADLFEPFRPSKLLFTRLDETSSCAAVFCEAARRQKPLSFFGTGQLIPEDLEPACRERVTESLARQLPETFRAVA